MGVKGLLTGLGFLLTAFLLSSLAPHLLVEVRTFRLEIFKTNCLLLFAQVDLFKDSLPTLPETCSMIDSWLPCSLAANGVVLMVLGVTKLASAVSIMNLLVVIVFYCNPMLDASFRSYAHFMQLIVCVAGFLVALLKEQGEGEEKIHKE